MEITQAPVIRKSTGPRTAEGKNRSKHNAVKHGILSRVTLLKGEPKAEYDALLAGLREDFKPDGTTEEPR
jgi:hypothetical protein